MADEPLHRLRIAFDVIYRGEKTISPSAARDAAIECSGFAQVLGFENVKNIEVVFIPAEDRIVYAHHHASSDGEYCRIRNTGCLVQAQDGLNQHNV